MVGDASSEAEAPTYGTGIAVHSDQLLGSVENTTYSTAAWSIFLGKRSRGTKASPTAVQTNDTLVGLEATGYGASAFGGLVGSVRVKAAENFTNTAQGTYLTLSTTPTGTTSLTEAVRVAANGSTTVQGFTATGAARDYAAFNYVTSGGVNNAITVTLQNSAGVNIPQADGLEINIKLSNSLQAGANTIALNGAPAVSLKSSRNPANNIGVAYAVGGRIRVMFDGTQYLDMGQ
jgi:hypothetical protein